MPVHTYGHKHMWRHWAKLGTKRGQIYYLNSSTSNSILTLWALTNCNLYLHILKEQYMKRCVRSGEVERGFIRIVDLVIKLSLWYIEFK